MRRRDSQVGSVPASEQGRRPLQDHARRAGLKEVDRLIGPVCLVTVRECHTPDEASDECEEYQAVSFSCRHSFPHYERLMQFPIVRVLSIRIV